MSLSWSPNWCALEGDARGDDQCDDRHAYTFTLHGLWPQYEEGWPSYCRTTARDPSRAETAAMTDIMGSGGLAWYQWKKHGRCSGLSAQDYFALARRAYGSIAHPAGLLASRPRHPPARQRGRGCLHRGEPRPCPATPSPSPATEGMIQEARICLTKDLQPRRCGADVIRDCRMQDAVMEAVR